MGTPNPNQIAMMLKMSTAPTKPGAEDLEAMGNRTIVLGWRYRISGRTNNLYTGRWQEFQEELAKAKKAV